MPTAASRKRKHATSQYEDLCPVEAQHVLAQFREHIEIDDEIGHDNENVKMQIPSGEIAFDQHCSESRH